MGDRTRTVGEEISLATSPDTNSDQPAPDLRTRPVRLQKRLGVWLWVAIAVVFIVLAIVIFTMRAAFL